MTEEVNTALLSMSYEERHKLIPASYLVLRQNDKVLLLRRFNTGYEDGKYSLPAGHVDRGETFTTTIIREAKEEIGIVLNPTDASLSHMMHRKSVYTERIDAFFVAEKWQGEVKNMEPGKCDDLSWHSIDELPENTIDCVRHAFECIRDGKFYSEFGW